MLTYTGLAGAGSQLGVVATANATTVTITPSVTTGGRTVGVPYNVSLNQGQAYQLRNDVAGTDLSGTIITSDKPIAVFGGNECANIPTAVAFCDHIVEEIPPTNTWGKSFGTMPLATRLGGDTFRGSGQHQQHLGVCEWCLHGDSQQGSEVRTDHCRPSHDHRRQPRACGAILERQQL